MSRTWRVYHPAMRGLAGERLALSAEEAHHVRRVLRLHPGDLVQVFDGRGAEWSGELVRCDPGGVEIVLARLEPDGIEAPLELVLHQSACRAERMDWVVQKATELGVAVVRVVAAARSEGGPPRIERWRRIAVEAAKQSGRRRVPAVETAAALTPPPADVVALLLSTAAAAAPLGARLAGAPPGAVWLAVGPEGGYEEDELAQASATGWSAVSLGPRVLRTETAGLVAATIVLHRWADLGSGAPRRVV